MSATPLTADHVRRLIGDIFVYHMPFNRELGLKLTRHENDAAQLEFERDEKLVGNALQRILHGGVIASVLDVVAGITCVTSALSEQDLRHRLARMGTIDMRVNYLLPGHGERFIVTSHLLRGGNKISVARAELHNNRGHHLATATANYLVG
ncbi:thioesterase family protein [Candidatus Sodalis endolongispinus]|uniref:Thioesterase family protein n=1 Tax=Candidatus Sodalis endolongispinus TaxID=2812662 RepID=A0ABS5Y9U7_9GAMM|nr:thioesterase family protein [Candidatus Sodalis endolongispinus]MBT9431780.1 thioesterase family protein [Candidatus Sodalis endolongispinus]